MGRHHTCPPSVAQALTRTGDNGPEGQKDTTRPWVHDSGWNGFAADVLNPDISPQSAQRPQRASVFQKPQETRLFRTFQVHSRTLTFEGRKYRGLLCVLCVLCGPNALSGLNQPPAVVRSAGGLMGAPAAGGRATREGTQRSRSQNQSGSFASFPTRRDCRSSK